MKFSDLPIIYQKLIILRMLEEKIYILHDLEFNYMRKFIKYFTSQNTFFSSFNWTSTPEGQDFWYNLSIKKDFSKLDKIENKSLKDFSKIIITKKVL